MLRERISAGIQEVIEQFTLPWHVTTAGAKGCVTFLPQPTRNLRDFLEIDGRLGEAHWLVQHNGGVFLPPWGKIEQWLISVQHTTDDADRLVTNVRTLATELAGRDRGR
jgi:glutamate-1-semialdehyde 2,1-aminomutase